jgi:Kef-type K+ transport system membrane component KefB
MNAFMLAAVVMLAGVVPCGVVAWRGRPMEAVVALAAIADLAVMVLLLLAQGFGRSGEVELPVVLAALTLGGALVYVHALERWL